MVLTPGSQGFRPQRWRSDNYADTGGRRSRGERKFFTRQISQSWERRSAAMSSPVNVAHGRNPHDDVHSGAASRRSTTLLPQRGTSEDAATAAVPARSAGLVAVRCSTARAASVVTRVGPSTRAPPLEARRGEKFPPPRRASQSASRWNLGSGWIAARSDRFLRP